MENKTNHIPATILLATLAVSLLISFIPKAGPVISLVLFLAIGLPLAAFGAYLHIKNYKWRYFHLGRNYKTQINKYIRFIYPDAISNAEASELKSTYRRTGKIFHYDDNPCGYMNFLSSLYPKHKSVSPDIIVLNRLYLDFASGGGLEYLFDFLNKIFVYSEYYQTIKVAKIFNDDIKSVLLHPDLKDLYLDRYNEELYIKYNKMLNSYFLFIKEKYESVVIMLYIKQKLYVNLPSSVDIDLYVSDDYRKRIVVYFDKATKSYRLKEEKFMFYDDDILYAKGGFIPENMYFDCYRLKSDALSGNKHLLKEYVKVDLNK